VNDRPRPSWADVEASLDRYDARALDAAVRAWIDEFMPRNIPWKKGRAELRDVAVYQRRLDLVLARHLGPWYGHRGWRVSNESFGGCFCHSFLGEYASNPRVDGVARATAWVLAEVTALTRCLREFSLVFRQFGHPHDPGDRAVSLAATIDQVFDAVIDGTACTGAWHRYVVDGVVWLVDHRSIEAPPVLEALVDASVSASCEDYLPVSKGVRYRLCDDLSTVLVLASR
jgi:hypothetical protein